MFNINIHKNYHKHCCCNTKEAKVIPDELIVWKKPDISKEEFERYKQDIFTRYPNLHIKYTCGNCDDELELWEGAGIATLAESKGLLSGGSGSGGMHGDDAYAYFISNIEFEIPIPYVGVKKDREQTRKERNPLVLPPVNIHQPVNGQENCNKREITVAVFDTGLLPYLKNKFTGNLPVTGCNPGIIETDTSKQGWNFVGKNSSTIDDNYLYNTYHGTTVSQFIINEVVACRKHKINLIPVKVLGPEGKGKLIDILCGIAYASNNGADIINASLGFYWLQPYPPEILRQFVKKYLTEKGILLITAAGNASENSDNEFRARFPDPAMSPRNLDHHSFFPACLSLYCDNVIAVTTVSSHDNLPSPAQNFSRFAVDLSVNGDAYQNARLNQVDYGFRDPLGREIPLLGSSFATPIITGKICANYDEVVIKVANRINKTDLISRIRTTAVMGVQEDVALYNYVRNGLYTSIA